MQKTDAKTVTRAEKTRRQKDIVKEFLAKKDYKWNELLEDATRSYMERYQDEENEPADLKGKIGSAFSLLEETGEVSFDKKSSVCSLSKKAEETNAEQPKTQTKKAAAKPKTATKKTEDEPAPQTESAAEKTQDEPAPKAAKKTVKKTKKAEEPAAGEVQEQPKADGEPAPKKATRKRAAKKAEETPEPKTEEVSEKEQETPAPKKTTRKRTAKKADEAPKDETKPVPAAEITQELAKKNEQATEQKKPAPVFDMTALLAESKAEKPAPQAPVKAEEKAEEIPAKKAEEKPAEQAPAAVAPAPKKAVLPEFGFLGNAGKKAEQPAKEQADKKPEQKAEKPVQKPQEKPALTAKTPAQKPQVKSVRRLPERTQKRELTEEEKLKAEFLKKLRSLGGSYFEYYSVYLLERYCMKNGRRLEGLKISGGDADGGIDGEISLTDRMGFKEVIYIQAKNWDPSKGDPDKWVVGETLLQQFVGAVTCRQAREGKRKCRGIFVTTSRFTEGAKEILNSLSADFVGYDGDDVFEAAKECLFGIVEKNGKLCLDEKLLSGEKAFFGIL